MSIDQHMRSSTFLLTRPSRDVTLPDPAHGPTADISTHTSLAGRDVYVRQEL